MDSSAHPWLRLPQLQAAASRGSCGLKSQEPAAKERGTSAQADSEAMRGHRLTLHAGNAAQHVMRAG